MSEVVNTYEIASITTDKFNGMPSEIKLKEVSGLTVEYIQKDLAHRPTEKELMEAASGISKLFTKVLKTICTASDSFGSKALKDSPFYEIGKEIQEYVDDPIWNEQFELRCKLIKE